MKPYSAEKTIKLTLAQAVVRFLQAQHSEYDGHEQRFIHGMWGIFGHGNVAGLSQGLAEFGQELPYHRPTNEQSMVHAATGFARAKRRKATMACTSSIGPGATNMITGAATATICRIPVLLLPSDYYASRYQGDILQGIDHLHSADMSVTDCFRVVSRFYDRITRPEQILTALPEAMRIMTDQALTGAVTIALPQDIQSYAYDYPIKFFEKRVWRIERPVPSPLRIQEAIELLQTAKRPYIIAGGGVHYSEAWDELAALSETFGIPVGETHAGIGAIRNGSPLLMGGMGYIGTPAAGRTAAEADLVICVGTRLQDFVTGSNSVFENPDVRFISINVNHRDAYKLGALPIAADAKLALGELTEAGTALGLKPNAEWLDRVTARKSGWEDMKRTEIYVRHPGERISQPQVIGILNDHMQTGDTLVSAAGTPPADLTKLFDASNGRTMHLEFGNSCMGYDIPAAIGVRMTRPDGEVFVLIGDGNYQMHPLELVTAVQERAKITVILVVNDGYQSIHGTQKALVGHSLGNEFKIRDRQTGLLELGDFVEVDYVKNAESFGLKAWLVEDESGLGHALEAARKEVGSCMIVVPVERHRYAPDSGVWWEINGAQVTNDPVTQALVEEKEVGRIKQRFHY